MMRLWVGWLLAAVVVSGCGGDSDEPGGGAGAAGGAGQSGSAGNNAAGTSAGAAGSAAGSAGQAGQGGAGAGQAGAGAGGAGQAGSGGVQAGGAGEGGSSGGGQGGAGEAGQGGAGAGGAGQGGASGGQAGFGGAGQAGAGQAGAGQGGAGQGGAGGASGAAGSGVTGPCAGVVYPPAPAGAGALRHVSWSCGDDAASDGSAGKPYKTVGAALAAAGEGATLLVEAGTYAEAVVVEKNGTQIIGSSGGSPEDAAIIFQSPNPYPLFIKKAQQVLVRGVKIEGAIGAGVGAEGAGVTLEGCSIVGTKLQQGQFGQGLVASAGSQVTLRASRVNAGEAQGIIFQNSGGLIEGSEIGANADAGVWLVQSGETTIQKNDIHDNKGAGVLAMGSRAIIFQNQIHKTKAAAWGGGDGVLATGAESGGQVTDSDVEIKENPLIGDNERAGILLDGSTKGIIFQNPSVDRNSRAGIWAQSAGKAGPKLEINGNGLLQNSQSGLVLRGSILASVGSNKISETKLVTTVLSGGSTAQVGDGVGLFDGAVGAFSSNTISLNGRLGLLADAGGAGSSFEGNQLNGNTKGIIFQNNGSGLTASAATNQVEGDDIQASQGVLVGVNKEPLSGVGP